jgi:acyl-coenzyme A synthetase/AMP-(fatty) acid ligase
LFFGYGFLYNILVNLYLGSTALLDSDLAIPSRVKNKLDEFKPTWFLAVPIIYSQLLDKISHDVSDITFVSSGDRLPQKLLDNWYTKTLTRIHNELGATEFSVITYNQEGSNIDIGSAINGYSIRVVDENNNEIEKGSIGRLQVFGNSMSVGYYSDEILTKSTFLDTNWANTNDMIFKDDNGKLYHLGRANDIIKTSRGFISPSEIEEVILSYFGIDQVAVISKPDENGVEYIEAHIVLSQGIDFKISGLKLWIKTKLNHCSVPSSIIIDESLPRTQTGKIQRYRLKEK